MARKLNNVVKKNTAATGGSSSPRKLKNVTINTSRVYGLETIVNDSFKKLQEYQTRRNNHEYMTADEISAYRKARTDYADSSSRLSGINKFNGGSDDQEEQRNKWLSELDADMNSAGEIYSKYKSADEYGKAVKESGYLSKYQGKSYADLQKDIVALQHKADTDKSLTEEIDWLKNYTATDRGVIDTMTLDDLQGLKGDAEKRNAAIEARERELEAMLTRNSRALKRGKTVNGMTRADIQAERKALREEKQSVGVLYYDDNGNAVTVDQMIGYGKARGDVENIKSDTATNHLYDNLMALDNFGVTFSDLATELRYFSAADEASVKDLLASNENRDRYYALAKANGIDLNRPVWEVEEDIEQAQRKIDGYVTRMEDAGYNWDDIKGYYKYVSDRNLYAAKQAQEKDYAKDHPVMATLENIVASPFQAADLVGNIGEGAYGLTNVYDDDTVNSITARQEGVTEKIDDSIDNDTLSWLATTAYSGISSSLQSAATAAACTALFGPAGQAVSLGLLGSQAAASSFNQAIKNGSTNGEALGTALISGIAEAAFEKVPLDELFDAAKHLDTSSVSKLIWSAVKQTGKQSLIEGLEEAGTNIVNTIADYAINGDHSQYYTTIEKLVRDGYSREEAEKSASEEWWLGLAGDFVGGLFGGLSSGITANAGGTVANYGNAKMNGQLTRMIGTGIKSDSTNLDSLINTAEMLIDKKGDSSTASGPPSLTREGLNDVAKALKSMNRHGSDINVGILSRAVNTALKSEFGKAETVEELDGIKSKYGDNNYVAEVYASEYERLTGHEYTAPEVQQNLAHTTDIPVNESTQKSTKIPSVPASDNIVRSKDGVGYRAVTTNGKDTVVYGVDPETGDFATSEGVIPSDQITFSDRATKAVFDNARNYSDTVADLYIGAYDPGTSTVAEYDQAFDRFYRAGNILNVQSFEDAWNNYSVYGIFDKATAEVIYKAGQNEARIANRVRSEFRKGKSRVYVDVDKKSLTSRQKVSIEAMEAIAKTTGIRFYTFASYVKEDNKRYYKDAKGVEKLAPNGYYDPSDSSIHIDLNAGKDGEGTMLFTVSHELTHYIKQWSPKKFKILADFLIEQYGKKGVSVETLIQAQIEKAAANNRTIDEDVAFEEVVADSMESMLTDGKVAEKLTMLAEKDMSLVKKIKSYLKQLFEKIRQAYEGLNPNSREGKLVAEMGDAVEKLQTFFAEAIADASENMAKGKVQNKETSSAIKYGNRTIDQKTEDAENTTHYSYESLPDDAFYKDGRIYDYDFLVAQPDMQVITDMPSLSDIKHDGRIDPDHVAELAFVNVEKCGGKKQGDVYLLENRYTNRILQIGKDSITHGIGGRSVFATRTNARLGSVIGEICKNAIPINGLSNVHNVKGTYTMVSLVRTKVNENAEWLVARLTIEQQNGKVLGIESLDVTHAVSGIFTPITEGDFKTKKTESLASQGPHSGDYVERAHKLSVEISIADLLGIVNRAYPEYLSDNVISSLGIERTKDKKGLFSDRDSDAVSSRSILADALESVAQTKAEKTRLAEYKEKADTLDQKQAELAEIRAQIKELAFAKGKKDTAKIAELRKKAAKLASSIDYYDKQLLGLEATKDLKAVLQREKAKAAKRQKAKDAAMLERYKEGRKKTELRTKIKKFKAKLESAMLNPTDNTYVPAGLISAMVDVCELIDTDTDLYKKDGSLNKAQEARNLTRDRLLALEDEYSKLAENEEYVIGGEFDESVQVYLKDLRTNYSGKKLSEMSFDELSVLYDVLNSINDVLQDAKSLIGFSEAVDVYEAADSIVGEQISIAAKHRKGGKRNVAQKGADWVVHKSLSPVRAAERMSGYNRNSFLVKLFNNFEKGVRKKNMFKMQAYKTFEDVVTGENAAKYESAMYDAYGREYTDERGRTFHVSKMQAMQTLLSYEREQANKKTLHIENGGLNFADIDLLSQGKLGDAIDDENIHRLRSEAAVAMVEEFRELLKDDAWAQKYMDAARTFFNSMAKDAINSTMLAVKHRIVAKDNLYVPYEVDKSFVIMEITGGYDMQQTINSYGMLQQMKDGAAQPLIITGLNNIIDRHIEQVGTVYGLAVPVRDFNKVWNTKSGAKPVNIAVGENWGKEAKDLITQAVADIQSPRVVKDDPFLRKIKSNYINATFFMNFSVITKQIGSMYSARSMIRHRSAPQMLANLAYTMFNYKKISAEVDKYTASVWMRRQGVSDAEVYDLLTEGKKHGIGKLASKIPIVKHLPNLIAAMDSAVALSLWKYCKQDVAKATGKTGEALLEATAEYFDEVVENTQSMADVLHRPEIQKQGGIMGESFGMFKTDLYQMAGQLQTALGRHKAEGTKETKKALAKAAYGCLSSAIWASLMTTLFALGRYKVDPYRDDEDELTAESWLKYQSLGLIGDLAGYIFPLAGGEMVGVAKRFITGESDELVDSLALTAIQDGADMVFTIADSLKKGEMPSPSEIDRFLGKSLQMFSVPYNNASRSVKAIKYHIQDLVNGEFLSFNAGSRGGASNAAKVDRYSGYIDNNDKPAAKDYITGWVDDRVLELIENDELEKADVDKDEYLKAYYSNEAKKDVRGYFNSKYKDEYLSAVDKGNWKVTKRIKSILASTELYENIDDTFVSWRRSAIVDKYELDYKRAYTTNDTKAMEKIKNAIVATDLWTNAEVSKKLKSWRKSADELTEEAEG